MNSMPVILQLMNQLESQITSETINRSGTLRFLKGLETELKSKNHADLFANLTMQNFQINNSYDDAVIQEAATRFAGVMINVYSRVKDEFGARFALRSIADMYLKEE